MLNSCGMQTDNLCQWIDKRVREQRTDIKTTVVVPLLYNAFFRRTCTRVGRYRDPHSVSCSMGGGGSGARLCGLGLLWYEDQVIRVSNDTDCDQQAQRCGQSKVPQALWERHVPHLGAMEESLYGTTWYVISPLLTRDEAARPSSLPPTPRKKRGNFLLQEYFRRGVYFVLQLYINSKKINAG